MQYHDQRQSGRNDEQRTHKQKLSEADSCMIDDDCPPFSGCNNGYTMFDTHTKDKTRSAGTRKYDGHCGGAARCAAEGQRCTGSGWSSFYAPGSNCCGMLGLVCTSIGKRSPRLLPYATRRKGTRTPSIPDDYYIKSICPSGGHGRGHRLALQNRAAARHVLLTVNTLATQKSRLVLVR